MKTIFITGIGQGIGRSLAEKFVKEGHVVIGTTQTGTIDYSLNVKVIQADLTNSGSIENCAKYLADTSTKIDILINNAGVLLDNAETSVKINRLRSTLEVNLIGTIEITEHLLPYINKGGHIVNISSQAGSIGDIGSFTHSHAPLRYPAYKISKAALNMYTRTLALRLSHENMDITVSAIHPGWVSTEMGGVEAPVTPDQAADDIYDLAISKPETGQFWFNGNKYIW